MSNGQTLSITITALVIVFSVAYVVYSIARLDATRTRYRAWRFRHYPYAGATVRQMVQSGQYRVGTVVSVDHLRRQVLVTFVETLPDGRRAYQTEWVWLSEVEWVPGGDNH